jgi:hypothetical protein
LDIRKYDLGTRLLQRAGAVTLFALYVGRASARPWSVFKRYKGHAQLNFLGCPFVHFTDKLIHRFGFKAVKKRVPDLEVVFKDNKRKGKVLAVKRLNLSPLKWEDSGFYFP